MPPPVWRPAPPCRWVGPVRSGMCLSGQPAEALLDAAMQVSGFTGEVTMSFLGDCTLGGESKAANSRGGFVQTALREGYDYPFLNLQSLLDGDDVTVVNLEGVLTDRTPDRVKRPLILRGRRILPPFCRWAGWNWRD